MIKKSKEISIKQLNKKVIVYGWVQKIRNLGEIIFFDLRSEFDILQIVIKKQKQKDLYDLAASLTIESVVKVVGTLEKRVSVNLKIKNGDLEINAQELEIINYAKKLPFLINDLTKTSLEETRLKFRYLDLRNKKLQDNLKFKSKVVFLIYQFMAKNNFINITTPILNRFTPEGAKDFLVINDLKENNYFALPQSPQLFKQLLMISGFPRYFQIANCFRDENLRANRQPEFLQLDLETSFVDSQDIIKLIIRLIKFLCKNLKLASYKIKAITYANAIKNYGIDHPDTRFEYLLKNLNRVFVKSNKNFVYKGILVPFLLKNKEIEKLKLIASQNKLNEIYFLKIINQKIINLDQKLKVKKNFFLKLQEIFKIENQIQYTLIIGCNNFEIVSQGLGYVRHKLIKIKNLKPNLDFEFLWIKNWPLFKKDDDNKITYHHHPFTSPDKNATLFLLNNEIKNLTWTKLKKLNSNAYDLVLNGQEIGSGSIRINNKKLQLKILKILGLSQKEIENNFSWFLDAFEYGVPIHGGIALGLERLIMSLKNIESIKDVVAFPKNNKKHDLLAKSPITIKVK